MLHTALSLSAPESSEGTGPFAMSGAEIARETHHRMANTACNCSPPW